MTGRRKCRVSGADPLLVQSIGWLVAAPCKSSQTMSARMSLRRFALAAVLLSALAAAAEEPKGVKVVQQPDKVIVRKRTVVDFGDVTVEGELVKPEGSYVLNRNKTQFEPLIRLRDDFDAELRKSADNL